MKSRSTRVRHWAPILRADPAWRALQGTVLIVAPIALIGAWLLHRVADVDGMLEVLRWLWISSAISFPALLIAVHAFGRDGLLRARSFGYGLALPIGGRRLFATRLALVTAGWLATHALLYVVPRLVAGFPMPAYAGPLVINLGCAGGLFMSAMLAGRGMDWPEIGGAGWVGFVFAIYGAAIWLGVRAIPFSLQWTVPTIVVLLLFALWRTQPALLLSASPVVDRTPSISMDEEPRVPEERRVANGALTRTSNVCRGDLPVGNSRHRRRRHTGPILRMSTTPLDLAIVVPLVLASRLAPKAPGGIKLIAVLILGSAAFTLARTGWLQRLPMSPSRRIGLAALPMLTVSVLTSGITFSVLPDATFTWRHATYGLVALWFVGAILLGISKNQRLADPGATTPRHSWAITDFIWLTPFLVVNFGVWDNIETAFVRSTDTVVEKLPPNAALAFASFCVASVVSWPILVKLVDWLRRLRMPSLSIFFEVRKEDA